MPSSNLILHGAGACGSYAVKHLREQGIEPLCFVDNNRAKFGTSIEGLMVSSPAQAQDEWPDATWVITAISRPSATEIRAQLKAMGVRTKPLYECLPVFHGNPSVGVQYELIDLAADSESVLELQDLYEFREKPDYEKQRAPSPISELYFPPFISHRHDEHYCDLGACDGDSVKAFMERWVSFRHITAFEPDRHNALKFEKTISDPRVTLMESAVGDVTRKIQFVQNGDYSSHIGKGDGWVQCNTLDGLDSEGCFDTPPTYIKMDIEGAELEALWGARKIIKEHSPVLAICAYHTSEHTWEIPLLIHAINPSYKLFFRRYAEGAFEIIWYAVPPERVLMPWSNESYSDNHTG